MSLLGCFPPKCGCCNGLVCFCGGAGTTSSGSLSLRLISDSDTEMCPKSGVGLSKMASFMLSSFWVAYKLSRMALGTRMGYSEFQVTGMNQWEGKSKPKTQTISSRASYKTHKSVPGVPHIHVNRPLIWSEGSWKLSSTSDWLIST